MFIILNYPFLNQTFAQYKICKKEDHQDLVESIKSRENFWGV